MCNSYRKSQYPERWMEICGNCNHKFILLTKLSGEIYGVICEYNFKRLFTHFNNVKYELDLPKKCLRKEELLLALKKEDKYAI